MRSRLSRHLETILHPAEARRAPGLFLLKREGGVKSLESEEPVLPAEFSWRDYAIVLLHVAAEIEHSLMVQYLFAAYSLGGPQVPAEGGKREQVRHWQEVILGIAKEEMGHFISVQNVLRLLGGPLNLEREDYPWGSDFYPFDFTLEPLTRDSLAKYIYAEMPDHWDTEEAREIKKRAEKAAPGQKLERVGVLYDRLQKVLKDYLKDSDFQADTVSFQASWDEWGRGYVRGARGDGSSHATQDTPDVIVRAVGTRDTAVDALHAIAEQGEARHQA